MEKELFLWLWMSFPHPQPPSDIPLRIDSWCRVLVEYSTVMRVAVDNNTLFPLDVESQGGVKDKQGQQNTDGWKTIFIKHIGTAHIPSWDELTWAYFHSEPISAYYRSFLLDIHACRKPGVIRIQE